jgi:hypothetical protein
VLVRLQGALKLTRLFESRELSPCKATMKIDLTDTASFRTRDSANGGSLLREMMIRHLHAGRS